MDPVTVIQGEPVAQEVPVDSEEMEDLADPVVQVEMEETEDMEVMADMAEPVVQADLAEPVVQVEVVVTVSSETKDTETLETQEHLVMVEKRN